MKKIMLPILMLALAVGLQAQTWRDRRMQPQRILDSLGVEAGMVIGEVGAGEGYFTMHLARRVGKEGKVIANDIRSSVLKSLEKKARDESLTQVVTLKGTVESTGFEAGSLDMAVMMYVFHELTEPTLILDDLARALKPGGTVAIIDRDTEKLAVDTDHFLSKTEALKRIREAGYEVIAVWEFLDRDNVYWIRPGADEQMD